MCVCWLWCSCCVVFVCGVPVDVVVVVGVVVVGVVRVVRVVRW